MFYSSLDSKFFFRNSQANSRTIVTPLGGCKIKMIDPYFEFKKDVTKINLSDERQVGKKDSSSVEFRYNIDMESSRDESLHQVELTADIYNDFLTQYCLIIRL